MTTWFHHCCFESGSRTSRSRRTRIPWRLRHILLFLRRQTKRNVLHECLCPPGGLLWGCQKKKQWLCTRKEDSKKYEQESQVDKNSMVENKRNQELESVRLRGKPRCACTVIQSQRTNNNLQYCCCIYKKSCKLRGGLKCAGYRTTSVDNPNLEHCIWIIEARENHSCAALPLGKKQNKTNKLTLHSTPLTQYESSVLITTAQRSKNATTEWRKKQERVPVRNQRDGSAKSEIIQETRSSSPVWLDHQQRQSGHSEHSDKNTFLCSIRWNYFCAWNSRNVNINTETKPGPAYHHPFNQLTWKIEEGKKYDFINKTS